MSMIPDGSNDSRVWCDDWVDARDVVLVGENVCLVDLGDWLEWLDESGWLIDFYWVRVLRGYESIREY